MRIRPLLGQLVPERIVITPAALVDPAAVLRRFGLDAALVHADVAGGFSGARIVRVESSGGTFALRRWPDGGLPVARLRELHRFIAFLVRHGIAVVPRPLASLDGETLVAHAGGLWQFEPWMPGTADFSASRSPMRLAAAVQALAEIHAAAAAYRPTGEGAAWFAHGVRPSPAVLQRLSLLRDWDAGVMSRMRGLVQHAPAADPCRASALQILADAPAAAPPVLQELCRWSTVPFALQPCLRDVWHDHVLFMGDRVTGIIDLAATRTEHVAADLARLLGSLLGDDWPSWRTALETYARTRPLTDEEWRLVGVLDRSAVLLSGLTWIDRLYGHAASSADRRRIADRLRQIAARLRRQVSAVDDVAP